jgi:hypothetical protein
VRLPCNNVPWWSVAGTGHIPSGRLHSRNGDGDASSRDEPPSSGQIGVDLSQVSDFTSPAALCNRHCMPGFRNVQSHENFAILAHGSFPCAEDRPAPRGQPSQLRSLGRATFTATDMRSYGPSGWEVTDRSDARAQAVQDRCKHHSRDRAATPHPHEAVPPQSAASSGSTCACCLGCSPGSPIKALHRTAYSHNRWFVMLFAPQPVAAARGWSGKADAAVCCTQWRLTQP